MIPQGILGVLQGQQGLQQPQNGMLLGNGPTPQSGVLMGAGTPVAPGTPMASAPMLLRPGMPGGATGAPQAGAMPTGTATPGATGMPVGGAPQPGMMPNLNAGNAGAMATGLNLAGASMPHPMGMPGQAPGLTSQGVMQALGGGLGGGMNPQLMQLLRQGGGYGTA